MARLSVGAGQGRERSGVADEVMIFNDAVPFQSPVQEPDFASDALVAGESEGEQINRDSVRDELGQLGVSTQGGGAEEAEKWEEELARELEDLGLETEGDVANDPTDSEQWENELQKMLEMHDQQ